MASTVSPIDKAAAELGLPRTPTIEERRFLSALVPLECRYKADPPIGPLTSAKVTSIISNILDKTHNLKEVRESLSRHVGIWYMLSKIFAAAIPYLGARSAGLETQHLTPQESTSLTLKNYAVLKDDLQLLNKLMHIARNMLVTPEPEVAQDLCAAVQMDQMVYEVINLCTDMTGKAYEGELDDNSRAKLNEITELFKNLLVTSLQQAHNWTAKNDRNKMSFWFDVLFDERRSTDYPSRETVGNVPFDREISKGQIEHYILRTSQMCSKARALLRDYYKRQQDQYEFPGLPPLVAPRGHNWEPDAADPDDSLATTSIWEEDIPDKYEQDRRYGRVSREIDTWWLKARDRNYDEWVIPMPTVDFAEQRADSCMAALMREAHLSRADDHDESPSPIGGAPIHDIANEDVTNSPVDSMLDEGDIDDADSYGEGPMNGLLTEIPNILDPKQIEALHMIVKSCILDNAGFQLSKTGENLQKTRCRMLLAMDSGKALLRELLVFLALWQKDQQTLIFQITTQIVEAIHHNALIPYAWQALRIPKDIISPAQTVLLTLINHIFRAMNNSPPPPESKEHHRDIKLLHFLFSQFRSRIVPECLALMRIQAQIRNNETDPAEFPADNWDMERANEGLSAFLEFLTTANELPSTRAYLVQWEAAYELVALLKGLEAAVAKKPLVELPDRSANRKPANGSSPGSTTDDVWGQKFSDDQPPPPPPPPPMQEPAHKFPWAGIKGEILCMLAGLLQPAPGKNSPGNPEVQKQIMSHNGIVPLLNCCVYDDHNRFARERVQLCLKWLMDGSESANDFLRDLVLKNPGTEPQQHGPQCPSHSDAPSPTTPTLPQPSVTIPGPNPTSIPIPALTSGKIPSLPPLPTTTTVRIDGIAGEVKVQIQPRDRSVSASETVGSSNRDASVSNFNVGNKASARSQGKKPAPSVPDPRMTLPPIRGSQYEAPENMTSRSETLLRDIISLAGEAKNLAKDAVRDVDDLADEVSRLTNQGSGQGARDADETEDEDFM